MSTLILRVWIFLLALLVVGRVETRADEVLEILSPHWEGMRYEIERGFNQQRAHGGAAAVKLNWIDVGGTSDILRFIHSEFKRAPSGIGVDLLFGGGIDPFIDLKTAGLLAQADAGAVAEIDLAQRVAGNRLHDPERFFFSGLISTFGIMCNRAVLQARNLPAPRTWMDLTAPAFASWVSIADPRRSGSSHLMFEVFLQGFGWQKGWRYLNDLAANTRVILPSSPQVGRDVVNGEAACGLLIDSHATAQISEFGSERLSFLIPADLPVMNGDGIGLLKGGPHVALANEFLTFVLSKAGQRILFLRRGAPGGPQRFELSRLPMRPDLYLEHPDTLVGANPFEIASPIRYDADLGSVRWNIINDLARTFLIDRSARRSDVFEFPVSEAEVLQLARSGAWKIPEQRLATIARWRSLDGTQTKLRSP